MSEQEQWRPIPGLKGYEVSDCGNVRSYWKKGGRVSAMLSVPHMIGQSTVNHGCRVVQPRGGGLFLVHRLVLMAFRGPCPAGMEGCHNDGNPANNNLDNLRWDTHAGNMADTLRHGTSTRGERNTHCGATEKQVTSIIALLKRQWSIAGIAQEVGVGRGVVANIRTGRNWKHRFAELAGAQLRQRDKLTAFQVANIVSEIKVGASNVSLARKYGVTPTLISYIRLGRIWKNISRLPKAPKHARCKRPRETVLAVIAELRRGATSGDVARKYRLPYMAVWQIKSGHAYRKLAGGPIIVQPGRKSA